MIKLKLFLIPFLAILAFLSIQTPKVDALSGGEFQASKIIDDHIFFNGAGMDPSQIQSFLNAKVPTCNTWHARSSNSNDSGAPYTCLKDYRQDTWNIPADAYCNGFSGGNKSAAQIIHEVGQSCGINQKVILITLQKEQSFITDDWPWTIQYTKATGFGCPDTALPSNVDANQNGCYDDYEGFFKQVYYGARQFKRYAQDTHIFTNYRPHTTSYVRYHPNANCGGTNLYIGNQATSGLYTYTPYQPNQAALNDLYGNGDLADPAWPNCSSFGNRNFWRMYNDWFNFHEALFNGLGVTINTPPDTTPFKSQVVTYTFTFTNRLSVALTLDAVGAVGRAGSITGTNRDLGWQGSVTFQPGESKQFTFTSTIIDTGPIYVWPAVNYQGSYVQYNNWGTAMNSRHPSTSLSTPLTSSVADPVAGQNVTFSAVLKNHEAEPISYDAIGIPVKFYDRYSYDAVWVGPGTLAPGAELTLSGTRNIDKPGPYTFWVSHNLGGMYTTIGSTQKLNAREATPNFSVSGITFSNTSPVQGGDLGASFSVTNNLPVPVDVGGVGVVGRLGTFNGPNRDIGWQGPVHFNAGETKTFTGLSRTITDTGAHHYWIGILSEGRYLQYNNWGRTIVSQAPNFSVSGLTFSSTSPAQGENLTASFSVKNNLSVPVDVGGVGVIGRLGSFNGPNRDIDWRGPVHFNAGETKSFTGYSRTITDVGTHYYWIGILNAGQYIQYNNWGSTIVSRTP